MRTSCHSGNTVDGIQITGDFADNDVVPGNFIGTDPSGSLPVGNNLRGFTCDGGSTDNTVGGTVAGAGNTIAYDGSEGVWLGPTISGVAIQGNSFLERGLRDRPERQRLPGDQRRRRRRRGGERADPARPSGDRGARHRRLRPHREPRRASTVVVGNYVGTDPSGTMARGNGTSRSSAGVYLGGDGSQLGGLAAAHRGVISSNLSDGVRIEPDNASVRGSYIGTDVTGASSLGNAHSGVVLSAVGSPTITGVTVGGTAGGSRNVISGNTDFGVEISGAEAQGNFVQGNHIGTNVAGALRNEDPPALTASVAPEPASAHTTRVAVTPKVVPGLRARTSTVDLDTEGGRAFLQRRVAFFNRVAFWVSGAFFVAASLAGPYYDDRIRPLLHAATLLVSLAAWLACARGPALSTGLLEAIDAAAVALVLVGFAVQAFLVPPAFEGEVTRSLALILTQMVVVRAVLVPSTAVRTAGVSVLAALPAAAAILWLPLSRGVDAAVSRNDRFWSLLWTACAVFVAALVSHVIFGLREEIQEARRLGQYTLEEKLGEGGMGAVYRARHAMLRRPTVVKLLPPEKSSEAALARFEREVQLTASLSHPNTVSVFDYGRTPDGIFYYAMEYLEGTDLDALVREDGPQPPARVARVLEQVASALVEAHGIGLIHRDIKPENIILCERGGIPDVAKVVDFGLVRDLEPASGARLTREDVVQGTPLYLSPEAIRAPDAVDARSDLYGLGAVGYYLLTGTHVFGGATAVEVCSHHLHTRPEPPSKRLGRPVPAGLERLVLACLEKDPTRRPGCAAALRDALAGLDDVGHWTEKEAREWWQRWRRRREERPPDVAARPARALDVALDRRGD